MPLMLRKKNLLKMLVPLLNNNEKIAAVLMTRGLNRISLALTDQKRLLITDIPLLGHCKVKEEYHIDEIEGIDFFPGYHVISLIIKTLDRTFVVKLPFTRSRFPFREELKKFTMNIREMNSRARPEYIEENENVIEIIKVKEGILSAFSIGFRMLEDEIVDEIRHITKLELYEVSIVSIPANREALFDISKGLKYGTDIVVPEYVLEDKIKEVMEEYNLQPINKDGETVEPKPERKDVSIIEYENFEKAYERVRYSLCAANLLSKISGKNFRRKLTNTVRGGR